MSDKLIRIAPAPSDAELQAERDRKHESDVAAWFGHDCECGHPWHEYRCCGQSFDFEYGTYRCPCPVWRPAT